ncbi:MAG: hypothetical protein BWY68_00941 [bacterium ADurb.Bin400]|nr:MAG: hypothetical protein BWY68_00941 [bacterium ADurb.Bin400]
MKVLAVKGIFVPIASMVPVSPEVILTVVNALPAKFALVERDKWLPVRRVKFSHAR